MLPHRGSMIMSYYIFFVPARPQKTMDGYETEEDAELVCAGPGGCLTLRVAEAAAAKAREG